MLQTTSSCLDLLTHLSRLVPKELEVSDKKQVRFCNDKSYFSAWHYVSSIEGTPVLNDLLIGHLCRCCENRNWDWKLFRNSSDEGFEASIDLIGEDHCIWRSSLEESALMAFLQVYTSAVEDVQ